MISVNHTPLWSGLCSLGFYQMVVVITNLRKRGIQIFLYLYLTWLLKGKSMGEVLCHIHFTLCLLDHLGLSFNKGKSTLVPTQRIEFIGALINYTSLRALLPMDHFQATRHVCLELHSQPSTTDRVCLRLLGHVATCQVVSLPSPNVA